MKPRQHWAAYLGRALWQDSGSRATRNVCRSSLLPRKPDRAPSSGVGVTTSSVFLNSDPCEVSQLPGPPRASSSLQCIQEELLPPVLPAHTHLCTPHTQTHTHIYVHTCTHTQAHSISTLTHTCTVTHRNRHRHALQHMCTKTCTLTHRHTVIHKKTHHSPEARSVRFGELPHAPLGPASFGVLGYDGLGVAQDASTPKGIFTLGLPGNKLQVHGGSMVGGQAPANSHLERTGLRRIRGHYTNLKYCVC